MLMVYAGKQIIVWDMHLKRNGIVVVCFKEIVVILAFDLDDVPEKILPTKTPTNTPGLVTPTPTITATLTVSLTNSPTPIATRTVTPTPTPPIPTPTFTPTITVTAQM